MEESERDFKYKFKNDKIVKEAISLRSRDFSMKKWK